MSSEIIGLLLQRICTNKCEMEKKRKKERKIKSRNLVFFFNVLGHSQDVCKTEDRLQQNSFLRWYDAKKKDDPKRQENVVAGEVRGVVCFLLDQFSLGLHCSHSSCLCRLITPLKYQTVPL